VDPKSSPKDPSFVEEEECENLWSQIWQHYIECQDHIDYKDP